MGYIYKITNQINGKIYVGKTINTIEERWSEHLRDYKKERCEKRPLYDAMNKYGIENFQIEIIEEIKDDEELCKRENYWINELKTYVGFKDCNGYNATLGGDGKKYKDYDIQEIIKKYQECYNLSEVGRAFNLDRKYIRQLLKANNISLLEGEELKKRILELQGHPVVQVDLNENIVINQFNSLSEAQKYINRPSGTYLSRACKSKSHIGYGYRWYDLEEWNNMMK